MKRTATFPQKIAFPTLTFLVLMISGSMMGSCQQSGQDSNHSSSDQPLVREVVSVERFAALMKGDFNGQLIDVRTPREFATGHLEGAVNIDFYDPTFEEQIKQLDRNKTVFVYCKAGGRSGKASDMMHALKFKKVYDMAGGYTAWSAKNK
ncbi:MAG: rhodanese-like domain-containing protein [Saprospiraceae bacterium]|nr:rhodanese-like domain-containing protein [Saprospiraceae bacterium]